MADITFSGGNKVVIRPLGFATDGSGAVVAGHTVAINPLVIEGATGKGCRGVAERTIQCRWNVTWIFARCINAMARRAVVCDTRVIKGSRDKGGGVVANATILIGTQVVVRLARGKAVVMTGRTVVYDAVMTKGCRGEARGEMEVTAIGVGWYVIVGFTLGGIAIVARYTVVHDALVIEVGIGECSGRVANRTIVVGGNVVWVGLCAFAGGIGTVVAGCAVVDDTFVAECRWRKAAACVMANTAIFSCSNMIRNSVFADSIGAVVA